MSLTGREDLDLNKLVGRLTVSFLQISQHMQVAIAVKDGDIEKVPRPPYEIGKLYDEYPITFTRELEFSKTLKKFFYYYPKLKTSETLIKKVSEIRNAFAHGYITRDEQGVYEITNFRPYEENGVRKLQVKYHCKLEPEKILHFVETSENLVRELHKLVE